MVSFTTNPKLYNPKRLARAGCVAWFCGTAGQRVFVYLASCCHGNADPRACAAWLSGLKVLLKLLMRKADVTEDGMECELNRCGGAVPPW